LGQLLFGLAWTVCGGIKGLAQVMPEQRFEKLETAVYVLAESRLSLI